MNSTRSLDIIIVYQGVVQINLTDGENYHMLDIMGRGSLIGVNNVVNMEDYNYNAEAVSDETTVLPKVSWDLIEEMMLFDEGLMEKVLELR